MSVDLPVVIDPAPVPKEVRDLRVSRLGETLALTWSAAAEASTHRVLRGELSVWYDHAADEAAGRGNCDSSGTLLLSDPDDAALGQADHYCLVVGVNSCGDESTSGFDSLGGERPARELSASCP